MCAEFFQDSRRRARQWLSDTDLIMLLPTLASYGILIFGAFICLVSGVGFLFPTWLKRTARQAWRTKNVMIPAVGARLVIGSALIYFAPYSRFPTAFRVIGALGLVAAVALLLLGWQRIDNIMAWADKWPVWLTRVWLLFGLAAGALVLYGAAGHLATP